jgi:hypothetical protein
MPPYNPESTKLPRLQVQPIFAVLSTFDGSVKYSFMINPEELEESHKAEFAVLPVLATAQPLIRYKSSSSSMSLPDLKFWSDTNDRDLSQVLATLRGWTKPLPTTGEPALLKFLWGDLVIPRCHLGGFNYKVIQWRSGKPTQATGSMELIYAPEPPKPQKLPTDKGTKLTDKEQQAQASKVNAALRDKPSLRKKLGIGDKDKVSVDANGDLKATDAKGKSKKVGKLSDVIAPPAKLNNVGRK